jgi:hypothetical protein
MCVGAELAHASVPPFGAGRKQACMCLGWVGGRICISTSATLRRRPGVPHMASSGLSELGENMVTRAHGVCLISGAAGRPLCRLVQQHSTRGTPDRVPLICWGSRLRPGPPCLQPAPDTPACLLSKASVASTGPEMVAADRPTSSPPRDVTWRREARSIAPPFPGPGAYLNHDSLSLSRPS